MRVMIAAAVSPFSGREEMHWAQAIVKGLSVKKVEVDLFMLPIVHNPLLLPEQMTALRLMTVENSSDLLITIGYPAFVLKHARKRVLLFSLAPSLHENFDSEYGILSTPQYHRIRGAVLDAEKKCLSEAEWITCASKSLAEILKADYNLKANTLILDDVFEDGGMGQSLEKGTWVVCESTLEPSERIDLLLSAVAISQVKWKLNIFVPSASDVYRQALQHRIERMALTDRVIVTETPLRMDVLKESCVYIALHINTLRIPESALRSVKLRIPIITASDCGALLEITTHEINGLVVEPSAKNIAQALDKVVIDKKLKQRLSQRTQPSGCVLSSVESVIEGLMG